jgi:hypothetical protein
MDSCSAEDGFMAHLWAGRRAVVDVVVNIAPGWSLAYLLEAARLTGYERARDLRDWLRARSSAPRSHKPHLAAPSGL